MDQSSGKVVELGKKIEEQTTNPLHCLSHPKITLPPGRQREEQSQGWAQACRLSPLAGQPVLCLSRASDAACSSTVVRAWHLPCAAAQGAAPSERCFWRSCWLHTPKPNYDITISLFIFSLLFLLCFLCPFWASKYFSGNLYISTGGFIIIYILTLSSPSSNFIDMKYLRWETNFKPAIVTKKKKKAIDIYDSVSQRISWPERAGPELCLTLVFSTGWGPRTS